jgi:hypothetical protein
MYIIQKDFVFHGSDDQLNQLGPDTYYIFAPRNFTPVIKNVLVNSLNPLAQIYKNEMVNPWTVWDHATKLESIRLQRDYLLGKSDWIVSKYAETLTEVPQNWRDYRQALRDFPSTVNVNLPIEQIVWPVSP